jgi:hypothetical protein
MASSGGASAARLRFRASASLLTAHSSIVNYSYSIDIHTLLTCTAVYGKIDGSDRWEAIMAGSSATECPSTGFYRVTNSHKYISIIIISLYAYLLSTGATGMAIRSVFGAASRTSGKHDHPSIVRYRSKAQQIHSHLPPIALVCFKQRRSLSISVDTPFLPNLHTSKSQHTIEISIKYR